MSTYVLPPVGRATAGTSEPTRRRFPQRKLRREALSDVPTTSGHLRSAIRYWRGPAKATGSCCSACNARLKPLQGEREWGRPFCNDTCVGIYARRTGRQVYASAD